MPRSFLALLLVPCVGCKMLDAPSSVAPGTAQLTSASVVVAPSASTDDDTAGGADCVTRDGAPYVAAACDTRR